MTVEEAISKFTQQLDAAGIGTARLDCLVLLEDATGKDRSWLLAHPDLPLQGSTLQRLKRQIKRRIGHEPLAYVRGKTEFYGREFKVSAHTLEPRPETETMIELLKRLVDSKQLTVNSQSTLIDVGTGSGAIAITAKLELPDLTVLATDIDEHCLAIAQDNAHGLGAEVTFYQGNLLSAVPNDKWQMKNDKVSILANLPYVPNAYHINQAAQFEPRRAIFGGPDGLELYKQLFLQIANLPQSPAFVLTEALPFQHHNLAGIARAHGYALETTRDFVQVFVRLEVRG